MFSCCGSSGGGGGAPSGTGGKGAKGAKGASGRQRVFGTTLSLMLEEDMAEGREHVPAVLAACAAYLRDKGMEPEGIFRRSPNAAKLRAVREAYNAGDPINFDEFGGIHMAANVIKTFLRELQEPILTFEMFEHVIAIPGIDDADKRRELAREHLQKLPARNLTLLGALVSFLAEVAAISDKNGMTASNIAIVFGPNLCWKQGMGPSSGVIPDLGDLGKIKAFTEFLFVNHEAIFEGLEKAGYSAQTL